MWTALSRDASWTLQRTLPDSRVPGLVACPPGSPVCSQLTSLAMSLSNGYGNYHAAFGTVRVRTGTALTDRPTSPGDARSETGATTQSTSGYTVMDPWNLGAMYGPQSFDVKFLFNTALVYHPAVVQVAAGCAGARPRRVGFGAAVYRAEQLPAASAGQ